MSVTCPWCLFFPVRNLKSAGWFDSSTKDLVVTLDRHPHYRVFEAYEPGLNKLYVVWFSVFCVRDSIKLYVFGIVSVFGACFRVSKTCQPTSCTCLVSYMCLVFVFVYLKHANQQAVRVWYRICVWCLFSCV